jgi:hypothetical protein
MEFVLDGIGDWVEDFLGDSTIFGVVVGYLHFRLEELVQKHLSLEVYNGCPCEFKTSLRKDHFAVDYKDPIFDVIFALL